MTDEPPLLLGGLEEREPALGDELELLPLRAASAPADRPDNRSPSRLSTCGWYKTTRPFAVSISRGHSLSAAATAVNANTTTVVSKNTRFKEHLRLSRWPEPVMKDRWILAVT